MCSGPEDYSIDYRGIQTNFRVEPPQINEYNTSEIMNQDQKSQVSDAYSVLPACRFDDSPTIKLLDFGHIPLGNELITSPSTVTEHIFPLTISYCTGCKALQVRTIELFSFMSLSFCLLG